MPASGGLVSSLSGPRTGGASTAFSLLREVEMHLEPQDVPSRRLRETAKEVEGEGAGMAGEDWVIVIRQGQAEENKCVVGTRGCGDGTHLTPTLCRGAVQVREWHRVAGLGPAKGCSGPGGSLQRHQGSDIMGKSPTRETGGSAL